MKVRYARVTYAPERRSYASHSEWQKSFPRQKKQGCFWIWSLSDKLWENLMLLLQRTLGSWLWYCTRFWCFTSEDGLSFEVMFFWRLSVEDSEDGSVERSSKDSEDLCVLKTKGFEDKCWRLWRRFCWTKFWRLWRLEILITQLLYLLLMLQTTHTRSLWRTRR